MASGSGSGSRIGQALSKSCRYHVFANQAAPSRSVVWRAGYASAARRRSIKPASTEKDIVNENPAAIAKRSRGRPTKKETESNYVFQASNEKTAKSPIAHLPPRSEWTTEFKKVGKWVNQHRFFLSNEDTIEKAVELMDLKRRKEEAGRGLTILEGYPGAGTLTRRFLFDDSVEKVIVMEDSQTFLPIIQDMQKDPTLQDRASKLLVKKGDCYHWETYQDLMEEGFLDHITPIIEARKSKASPPTEDLYSDPSWTAPSPILFVCHLPSTVHGEQLISQFVSAIGNRYWQYRYSRMPIVLVCSEQLAQRCTAQPGERLRSRMSVISQALTDVRILMDSSHLLPHHEHFWPDAPVVGRRLPLTPSGMGPGKLSTGQSKEDNCLLLFEPKVKPMISGVEFEAYEYLIKGLFVMKASSIKKALKHMLPGAVSILDAMKRGHPAMTSIGQVDVDPEELVCNLTVTQLVALAKMFERWPFRPQHLFSEGRMEELRLQT